MDAARKVRGLGAAALVAFVVAGCGSSGESDAGYTGVGPGAGGAAGKDGGDASAGSGGDGGGAGTEDAGEEGASADGAIDGGLNPDVPLGTPISAPDGKWTRIDFPNGYCRNGETAHLMAHLNSASKKFAIYLEGGGACFNDASCTLMTFDMPSYVLGQGIFNFGNADNPIRDWNVFYVPYCTGDVHAGDNAAGKPGPLTPAQHYSGYTNMKLYLSRILATVPDATDELLTGSSAGGFGAGLTADLVARNMPASVQRFTMLDDSGPPMSSAYIPSCLQDDWQNVWGFQNTVLKDCGSACTNPKDWTYDFVQFLLDKYAKGPNAGKFMAGLVSASGDAIISTFFGFGANNCTTSVPIAMSGSKFEAGLLDLRTTVKAQTTRFGTFYYGSTSHTTLMLDSGMQMPGVGLLGGLYVTKVGGVKLTDWIRDLLDHKPATHIGP